MPLVLTLALTKFRQGLERKGIDTTNDQAIRAYVYSLLERDLITHKPTPTSKPSEEVVTFTI